MALLQSARSVFPSCPIASRFIDTLEDCRSYYLHRIVGDRSVVFANGERATIRFGQDEVHPFTQEPDASSKAPIVQRKNEAKPRQFSALRARLLDAILPTIREHVTARAAKNGGVMLYGAPVLDGNTRRMCVVLASDRHARGVWFVRTAYAVCPREYAQAMRSATPTVWPPPHGAPKEKAPSHTRNEASGNRAHTREALQVLSRSATPGRDHVSGGGCPSGPDSTPKTGRCDGQ